MPRATRKSVILLLVLVLGGAAAWWQRTPLLAWYYVHQLSQVEEAKRDPWVERVTALNEAAIPGLLGLLTQRDARICGNARAALVALALRWGPDDPRVLGLLAEVKSNFAACAPCGQESALQLAADILHKAPAERVSFALLEPTTHILTLAHESPELRLAALRLADTLVQRSAKGNAEELARRLALQGLGSDKAAERLAAVQVLSRPPFREDRELLSRLVLLVKDAAADVRQAALLVLGPARDVLPDDDLLPLLHDADDDIVQACEAALRSRGLSESHILLARLITDARPTARLQVLQHLRQTPDLDAGVWLRRLCQDPEAAVRAAAVRAAAAQDSVDLSDCLQDLARQDPSPTVRQLAAYYWSRTLTLKREEY